VNGREDFPAVWRRALDALDALGVTPQHRAFVRLTRLVGLLDGTALLLAPNELTKEILEQRMREPITQVLSDAFGHPVRLAVTVDSSMATEPGQAQPSGPDRAGAVPAGAGPEQKMASLAQRKQASDIAKTAMCEVNRHRNMKAVGRLQVKKANLSLAWQMRQMVKEVTGK